MFEDSTSKAQAPPSRLSVTKTIVVTRDIDRRVSKTGLPDRDLEVWDQVKTDQDV